MDPIAILVIIIVAVVFITVSAGLKIITQFEKGLIERFGKFDRMAEPGLRWIVPFIERIKRVDMREQVADVPPQEVITMDNVVVTVDAVVYYQPTDPVKLKYNVANFMLAATKLAQTNLRNVIGEMDLDGCLSSRDEINGQLRDVLDRATDKWGVKVNRVELQRIDPPRDITEAMSRQMKAEREKRAAILEAEGVKQAEITKAEGSKQSQILEAAGAAEAVKLEADAEKYRRIQVAQGESEAIQKVFDAIHAGKPNNELITLKYLEMLPKLAEGEANKIFMPIEASGMISSLAAMVEGVKDKAGSITATN